ncbi:MAG: helix-hairpin-helix domain-containing protein [Gemmatimonadota bacterium]
MSLTAGERRALVWLLAVTVVAAGVRLTRNWRHAGDSLPGADEALKAQLLAVDSAQRAGRGERGGKSGGRTRVGQGRQSSAVARGRRASPAPSGDMADPAVEITEHRPRLVIVDVDVADSAALERLPRIGPALAARIVADRQAHGPFGSLEGLERVRGIGSRLAHALASHVTFSGIRRPSAVQR